MPIKPGFSGCTLAGDSYVTCESVGMAQGQVIFDRVEGATSTVDKTFSFDIDDSTDQVVVTRHHSSLVIDDVDSTQYVFED